METVPADSKHKDVKKTLTWQQKLEKNPPPEIARQRNQARYWSGQTYE